MATGHPDLPPPAAQSVIDKTALFAALLELDRDDAARGRILRMETDFRRKADIHIGGLTSNRATFARFNTNPFVLLLYAKERGYAAVHEIERDIAPAKLFSSMETSAGKIVEEVTLPVYGWEQVNSEMHSVHSKIDGRRTSIDNSTYDVVSLKSGPRCLNDDSAKGIGADIAENLTNWGMETGAKKIVFTLGVLYGTKNQSNKKDWHVIRNLAEGLSKHAKIISSHKGNWGIEFELNKVNCSARVRIGREWWSYLGGSNWTFLEVCVALIRACVLVKPTIPTSSPFMIGDLPRIVDTACIQSDYNISLLQRSQYEWLLFAARHFCDRFSDDGSGLRKRARPKQMIQPDKKP